MVPYTTYTYVFTLLTPPINIDYTLNVCYYQSVNVRKTPAVLIPTCYLISRQMSPDSQVYCNIDYTEQLYYLSECTCFVHDSMQISLVFTK